MSAASKPTKGQEVYLIVFEEEDGYRHFRIVERANYQGQAVRECFSDLSVQDARKVRRAYVTWLSRMQEVDVPTL